MRWRQQVEGGRPGERRAAVDAAAAAARDAPPTEATERSAACRGERHSGGTDLGRIGDDLAIVWESFWNYLDQNLKIVWKYVPL